MRADIAMNIYDWNYTYWGNWEQLPNHEACYAFITNTAKALYIGRTKMISSRLKRHTMNDKLSAFYKGWTKIYWNRDAYDDEKELIQMYRPLYNVDHLVKNPGRWEKAK